jgi:peroxiredoxin
MKHLAWFIALIGLQNSYAQGDFTISGKLGAIPDRVSKVVLGYMRGGEWASDTASVLDGQYAFSGKIAEPLMARLMVIYESNADDKRKAFNMRRDMANVFLVPAAISVISEDSFSNIKVNGSAAHAEYLTLRGRLRPISEQQESLSKEYGILKKNNDEAGLQKLEAKFDSLDTESKKIYRAYFQANLSSPIALFALEQVAGWDLNADEVGPLFNALPASAKQLPSARELSEKIETARKTGVGQTAMDFTQQDTSGNPVTLSSFRGSYVLIDFWASWCGPCRAENPNVVKAYQRFREKGFQIIGVSLDQANARDKWIKAIHDDQLTWTQVSDLKFWKNAVAVQYGIQAIPQNFLIDPAGKIVAKNLRGEELMKKLETLMNIP